jgi:hypothetical protein
MRHQQARCRCRVQFAQRIVIAQVNAFDDAISTGTLISLAPLTGLQIRATQNHVQGR